MPPDAYWIWVDMRQRCEFCSRVRSHGNHTACSAKRKAKYRHLHD